MACGLGQEACLGHARYGVYFKNKGPAIRCQEKINPRRTAAAKHRIGLPGKLLYLQGKLLPLFQARQHTWSFPGCGTWLQNHKNRPWQRSRPEAAARPFSTAAVSSRPLTNSSISISRSYCAARLTALPMCAASLTMLMPMVDPSSGGLTTNGRGRLIDVAARSTSPSSANTT